MLWFKVLNNKEVLMCPMDAVLAPSLLPGSLLDLCHIASPALGSQLLLSPCLFQMLPQPWPLVILLSWCLCHTCPALSPQFVPL